MQPAGELIKQEPMHPDDFKAHLDWVTAKRFRKLVVKESFFKKTLYITGSADDVYTLLTWNKKKKNICGGSAVCNSDTVLKRRASFLIKYSLP